MASSKSLIKQRLAWFPFAMSLAAFALVVSYVVIFGIAEQTQKDEGAAARIFQLLMVGQLPLIAVFAFKWFPKKSKETLQILALQIVAALVPFGLVLFLEL